MEIIPINQDKLKIILTKEDRCRYRLNESLIDEKESTKLAVRKLIADVTGQSAFSPQPGRTLLQLYESKDGGCEIFITRLPACVLDDSSDDTEDDDSPDIFRFDSSSEIIRACFLLNKNGFRGVHSVILHDRWWYLVLTKQDYPLLLFDFGIPVDGISVGYLNEYGRRLPYRDAVCTLASLCTNYE